MCFDVLQRNESRYRLVLTNAILCTHGKVHRIGGKRLRVGIPRTLIVRVQDQAMSDASLFRPELSECSLKAFRRSRLACISTGPG